MALLILEWQTVAILVKWFIVRKITQAFFRMTYYPFYYFHYIGIRDVFSPVI